MKSCCPNPLPKNQLLKQAKRGLDPSFKEVRVFKEGKPRLGIMETALWEGLGIRDAGA